MATFYTYKAVVVKVVDGDTIDLRVDLGFRVSIDIRTRVRGVNAPELKTPEGKTVRDVLANILQEDMQVTVTTMKDPTDKYGRWLADINFGGQDLASWLLSNNYAKPYK